jgi:tripartite-type tricarboxylate transporter receptor subunit TctC
VEFYIGFPPGGGTANAGVILAEGMKKYLKQPVMVNYKPGASGAVAAAFVGKCKPDGYSLIFINNTDLPAKLALDGSPCKLYYGDLECLGGAPYAPYLLAVNAESPWKSLEDLIAFGRKSLPKTLTFASSGVGAIPHLSGEAFSHASGVVLNHIPFQGGGPADTALLGGHVHMCFGSVGRFGARIKPGGGLRPLAICDQKKHADFPDVPTMSEKGIKMFDFKIWCGLHTPKGLPSQVKMILIQAFERAAKDPQIISMLNKAGYDYFYLTPEAAEKQIEKEYGVYHDLLMKIGLIKK